MNCEFKFYSESADDFCARKTVKYWALRAMNWFRLEGFIIFKSSEKNYPVELDGDIVFKYNYKNYHVVFNHTVSWRKNVHIMAWVAMESQIPKLKDYVLMQCIKKAQPSEFHLREISLLQELCTAMASKTKKFRTS